MSKFFPVPIIGADDEFPDPLAPSKVDKKVRDWKAVTFELNPDMIIRAYRKGIFPWPTSSLIYPWYSLDPRMCLKTDGFKASHSLKKRLKHGAEGIYRCEGKEYKLEVFLDKDTRGVIDACRVVPRKGQQLGLTWILDEVEQAYSGLIDSDNLHSVELYLDGKLRGGLYGVSIGKMFYGESMFHEFPDLSKMAASALVNICKSAGIKMIDCQQETPLLASLGAKPLPLNEFLRQMYFAVELPAPKWSDYRNRLLNSFLVSSGSEEEAKPEEKKGA